MKRCTSTILLSAIITLPPIAGSGGQGLTTKAADDPPLADKANTVRHVPGWGDVTDPNADCLFEAKNGNVTITVPGGTVHTLSNYFEKRNAPRILQEVEGDFTVQVKVNGEFDPGSEPADGVAARGRPSFNGAGLVVWDSDQNYLRLERNIWVTSGGKSYGYSPLLEYWKDNRIVKGSGGGPDSSANGQCTYLRMTRHGEEIRVAISRDGVAWTEKDSLTAQLPKKVKLGVAAINSSKKPFTVEFSEFKLTRG